MPFTKEQIREHLDDTQRALIAEALNSLGEIKERLQWRVIQLEVALCEKNRADLEEP
jgi:hypothetical protein